MAQAFTYILLSAALIVSGIYLQKRKDEFHFNRGRNPNSVTGFMWNTIQTVYKKSSRRNLVYLPGVSIKFGNA